MRRNARTRRRAFDSGGDRATVSGFGVYEIVGRLPTTWARQHAVTSPTSEECPDSSGDGHGKD